MIEQSDSLNELAAALAQAQAEIKNALRESANPFFKSKYADLASTWEACRPALTSHGLSVTQWPFTDEHAVGVTTMLLHASGQWLRGRVSAVPKDLSPQSVGSTVSYLKRYSLAAVAGVATEDDDAETAQARPAPTPRSSDIGRPDRVTTPTTDAEVMQAFPLGIESDDQPDPRPDFLKGSKTCPYCKTSAVIKGKAEYGGGWVCFTKRGGCGQKWPELAVTAGGKTVDTATGEVKDDDRPFLMGAVIKGLRGLTGDERGELFTIHLDGHDPTAATTEQLRTLYLFLGDEAKVKAWRGSRVAR